MKPTKSLTVAAVVVLVGAAVVITPAAVPGVTAQQTTEDEGLVVDALDAPATASQDENISVEATITNNGSTETTEPVEFRIDGNVVDTETVTLGAGQTENVTLSANTDEAGPGEIIHGVFTPSDGQLATLTISESFVIDEFDAPDTAQAGDEVTVTTDIRNPNDFNATQNVTFRLEGRTVETEEVTLADGETTTLNFTLSTTGVAPGEYTHSIFTRDFGQFEELNVTAPPTTTTPGNGTATTGATPTGTPAETPTPATTPTATPAGTPTP